MTHTDEAFLGAFAQLREDLAEAPLNVSRLGEAQVALQALSKFASYERFLTEARVHKARLRTPGADFERQVLRESQKALADAQFAFAGSLQTAKQVKNAGLLGRSFKVWQDGVREAGRVQLRDVWLDAIEHPDVRRHMADAGLDDRLITRLTEAVREVDQVHQLNNGMLEVRTRHGDTSTRVRVRAPRGVGRPGSVSDLLVSRRFDVLAEAFAAPGATPGIVTHRRSAAATEPLDALLGASTLALQSLAQHVRKLEDTGLETYSGEGPETWATVVVVLAAIAVAAIVVGGLILLLCKVGDDDSSVCDWGSRLLWFGIFMFIGVYCLANPDLQFSVDWTDSGPSPSDLPESASCGEIAIFFLTFGVMSLFGEHP